METDIEKLANEFESATELPGDYDVFGGTNLKNEGKKLELLAGKLFYLSKKEMDHDKRRVIDHTAKLILQASEQLQKLI